jgi:hypothetical protein
VRQCGREACGAVGGHEVDVPGQEGEGGEGRSRSWEFGVEQRRGGGGLGKGVIGCGAPCAGGEVVEGLGLGGSLELVGGEFVHQGWLPVGWRGGGHGFWCDPGGWMKWVEWV